VFLDQLTTGNRTTVQRIAVVFFVLFALSVLDLMAFILAESKTVFKVVAGKEIEVSGKLAEPIDRNLLEPSPGNGNTQPVDINHVLTHRPGDRSFTLRFTGVEGRLWRGVIRVAPFAEPADLPFQVLPHGAAEKAESPMYHLFVYPDEAAYRRSCLSLTKRWTGIDPLWLPLLLLPAGLLLFVAVFKASREEDRRLQERGIGPIYKLARGKDRWEIVFGLGASHGVRAGDRLLLMDAKGQPVGEIVAAEVAVDYGTAQLPRDSRVRADFMVARAATEEHP
jgi:hypothetical protein